MTIEEAIAHHEWAMNNCDGDEREEQAQYLAWLRQNVALKALVADMWERVRHTSRDCVVCPLRVECAASDEPCIIDAPIRHRMRELGVMP